MQKTLQSLAYYAATVRSEVDEKTDPVEVHFVADKGARYAVSGKRFKIAAPAAEEIALPPMEAVQPEDGAPADAESIIAGGKAARAAIAERNCLRSVEVTPAVQLNTGAHTVEVVYEVSAGPKADFGAITVTGNDSVKEQYIRSFAPWKKGECFHAQKIDNLRTRLIETQLFTQVSVTPAETPDTEGGLPVTVEVKERYHRTVKAGVSYMTDEGAGISAGWEHRNFFGSGEKLSADAVASQIEKSLGAQFTKPYFLRRDQSLNLNAKIAEEDPDAYTSRNLSVSGTVDRKLSRFLKGGAGLGYPLSQVEDVEGTENYGFLWVPLFAEWDSRNNALNPSKGSNVRLDIAPYFDTLGSGSYFLRSLGTARGYLALNESKTTVLALRGALGSITAASTRDVPADLRFYAGGGSSVRGYGYQDLSPRRSGEPFGGRSLVELSSELRFKFTETIGAATFVDAGNAYDSIYPDFEQPLRIGAGVGLRYYTDFGPLRLDVAVPVNGRDIDSAYQLYVSLGQAF